MIGAIFKDVLLIAFDCKDVSFSTSVNVVKRDLLNTVLGGIYITDYFNYYHLHSSAVYVCTLKILRCRCSHKMKIMTAYGFGLSMAVRNTKVGSSRKATGPLLHSFPTWVN